MKPKRNYAVYFFLFSNSIAMPLSQMFMSAQLMESWLILVPASKPFRPILMTLLIYILMDIIDHCFARLVTPIPAAAARAQAADIITQ